MQQFHAYNLRRRFERLNPGLGADLVDWSILGNEENYTENLEVLKSEYPAFKWEDIEDYDSYARDYFKEEAAQAGLRYTNIRETKPLRDGILTDLYNQILHDVKQNHIMLLSEGGHGKTTGLKSIVKYCKEHDPTITFKVIDNSLQWNKTTPTTYIQTVTMERIENRQILNLCDCTYQTGELPEPIQRGFISTMVSQDYERRYALERDNPEELEKQPTIVYVIEESNLAFGSYALRSSDPFTEPLKKFISVGRNLKLRAVFVAQVSTGEISTAVRRRTHKLYGKIISESDLAPIRRKNRDMAEYLTEIPRYHFIYDGSHGFTQPTKIPDICDNKPIQPNPPKTTITQPTTRSQFNTSWILRFGLGALTTLALISFLI